MLSKSHPNNQLLMELKEEINKLNNRLDNYILEHASMHTTKVEHYNYNLLYNHLFDLAKTNLDLFNKIETLQNDVLSIFKTIRPLFNLKEFNKDDVNNIRNNNTQLLSRIKDELEFQSKLMLG